jgi:citrate synthase
MEISNYAQLVRDNYKIDKSMYDYYDVKIGLRNKDGSGVLVGLTKIGDVHGYIRDEMEIVPVPGKLRYRGIDVEHFVDNVKKNKEFGFEETSFYLIFGKLPTKDELAHFCEILDANRELPDGFTENMILKAPSNNIMIKLARSILASYSYDQNPEDLSIENIIKQSIELIARFPTLIAYGYQAKSHYYNNKSLYIHNPVSGIGTAKNFLRMIRADRQYTELEAQSLDICLILHAEHGGGNNSAFATRVITSSDTDTYSAISAAVGSLKGYKHGGANIKVMEMMDDIKANIKDWGNEEEIRNYLIKILSKEAFDKTGLIYGLGHAVIPFLIREPLF